MILLKIVDEKNQVVSLDDLTLTGLTDIKSQAQELIELINEELTHY